MSQKGHTGPFSRPVGCNAVRPVTTFVVESHLPAELEGLQTLAANWRWSWHTPTRDLFARLDPDSWGSSGGFPFAALRTASSARIAAAAADPAFVTDLLALVADLGRTDGWFSERASSDITTIAYFSPEFGVSEALPQYSGGLGILAGDHLKAASDLGVPIVAVGLFYRHGYFRQQIGDDGWQRESYPALEPADLGLTDTGVTVRVDFAGRPVSVRVWRADVGRVPLYLLDTDTPDNPQDLRSADRLYGGDREHRLQQEILLGIGGVKALTALGIEARVFHSNEGHAGFLALERLRGFVSGGMSFREALEASRAGTIFTTHTPVVAGIDRFEIELMRRYFSSFAAECGVTFDELFSLGNRADEPGQFNMAVLGLRMSSAANGVAALHGDVSREMFAALWPDLSVDEVPIGSVTNGVHAPTWVAPEVVDALAYHVGHDWDGGDDAQWRSVSRIPTGDLEGMRRIGKRRLVDFVRDHTGNPMALDPDALTFGFARRFATYKRATLLLSQPARLAKLLADHPVQFVFAGKAHPADDEGKRLIQQIVNFGRSFDADNRFVFLADYDMAVARALEHGSDVWLNTPRRPMEACGTSGMKAALNGALNCSIRDGWWDEWSDGENGWDLVSRDDLHDVAARDAAEAEALYDLLEQQVVPLWADREGWWNRVRHNWATLGPKVTASRMVREYVETLYEPTSGHALALADANWSGARGLAAWRATAAEAWPKVAVSGVELAADRTVTCRVELAGLTAADVRLEVWCGRLGADGSLLAPVMSIMGLDAGRWSAKVNADGSGEFGIAVRAVPSHPALPCVYDMGVVRYAG